MAREISLAQELPSLSTRLLMTKDGVLSEREILAKVKAGDKQAYQAIVAKYMKKAYFIALGYVHNHQDALDLSQESFIRAYRMMKKFDLERPFLPWLYEILKNLSLDHLKSRHRHEEIPLDEAIGLPVEAEDREMKATIWKGIDSLPFDLKEILLLRYFQQFSYREIAELTGKPIGTVMSGLFNARLRLRHILRKFLGGEGSHSPGRGHHGA